MLLCIPSNFLNDSMILFKTEASNNFVPWHKKLSGGKSIIVNSIYFPVDGVISALVEFLLGVIKILSFEFVNWMNGFRVEFIEEWFSAVRELFINKNDRKAESLRETPLELYIM